MTTSPYQAPQAALTDPEDAVQLQVAGRGQRFANLLIDYVIFIVLIFAITFAQLFIMGDVAFDRFANSGWADLLGFAIYIGYYAICEGLWGRTVGKLITGTKVVDELGQHPSWGKVIGRTLSRFIPFEPFSIFGDRRLCWHDSIPRTKVVRSR